MKDSTAQARTARHGHEEGLKDSMTLVLALAGFVMLLNLASAQALCVLQSTCMVM
jgi:hypothetical protein